MTQWFQERYISREEHKQTVDYYRKLVVHLYSQLRDLRAQAELFPVAHVVTPVVEPDIGATAPPDAMAIAHPNNIVRVDFRRRSR